MRKSGYTLIEMLVVLAIISLLFSAVFGVLTASNTSFNTSSVRQTIENQARQGLDNMLRELYETSGGRVVLSEGNSVITFKLPVGFDGSGNLLWGAEGVQDYKIRYLIDNKQLIRRVLNASDILISQKVLSADAQSLKFALLPNMLLTITLAIQKNVIGGGKISQSVSSKVVFRN